MEEQQKSGVDAIKAEIEQHKKALEKNPADAGRHARVGDLLRKLGNTQEAKRHYDAATLYEPALADVWVKLGHIHLRECNLAAALANYGMTQAYQPRDMMRLWSAMAMPPIMTSRVHMDAFHRRVERGLDFFSKASLSIDDPSDLAAMLFYLSYHGRLDRMSYQRLADIHLKACPSLGFTAPHTLNGRNRKHEPRIKVGFVSRFFFEHSIGRLMRGVIANLDRERFHVTVVVIPHIEDKTTEEIVASADKSMRAPLNLDEARFAIAGEEFDVIVYPEIGMDSLTYCLAFARLAPVQCMTWGHPVTSGIPNMDYFISSGDLETEVSDEHYRETLFRLDITTPYYLRPKTSEKPKGRGDFGLADDSHYYFIAQYLFKLHPNFDHIIGEILRGDPKGQILLVQHPEKSWSRILMARLKEGIPDVADRIKFVPFMDHVDFLALMACVDVCLDIPTFSGGNTTIEALSVGTPVVTLPGKMMRARLCAAICRQIGLTECIAKTPEEYVEMAVRLTCDPTHQKKVREKILERNDELFENAEAVREWERFFVEACKAKGVS